MKYQKSESEHDSDTDHKSKSYNLRSKRKKEKIINERLEDKFDDAIHDEDEDTCNDEIDQSMETRRRLRDLISDEDLNFETQIALKNEKERQKRLEERRQVSFILNFLT